MQVKRWREMLNAQEFGPSGLVPVCAAVARQVTPNIILMRGAANALVAPAPM